MGYFAQLISKEGETISHYVHSFESSRNSTTNLKESKWATAVNLTAVVRSQPSFVDHNEAGLVQFETILVLTEDTITKLDVVLWNSKYFDVIMVEEVFMRGNRQYYKATCLERLEFIGN